jgi:hypothetical protein
MERVRGIEPLLSAWKAEVLPLNYTRMKKMDGRDDTIRTCDPLVPNQVLYQAELRPDNNKYAVIKKWRALRDSNSRPFDS